MITVVIVSLVLSMSVEVSSTTPDQARFRCARLPIQTESLKQLHGSSMVTCAGLCALRPQCNGFVFDGKLNICHYGKISIQVDSHPKEVYIDTENIDQLKFQVQWCQSDTKDGLVTTSTHAPTHTTIPKLNITVSSNSEKSSLNTPMNAEITQSSTEQDSETWKTLHGTEEVGSASIVPNGAGLTKSFFDQFAKSTASSQISENFDSKSNTLSTLTFKPSREVTHDSSPFNGRTTLSFSNTKIPSHVVTKANTKWDTLDQMNGAVTIHSSLLTSKEYNLHFGKASNALGTPTTAKLTTGDKHDRIPLANVSNDQDSLSTVKYSTLQLTRSKVPAISTSTQFTSTKFTAVSSSSSTSSSPGPSAWIMQPTIETFYELYETGSAPNFSKTVDRGQNELLTSVFSNTTLEGSPTTVITETQHSPFFTTMASSAGIVDSQILIFPRVPKLSGEKFPREKGHYVIIGSNDRAWTKFEVFKSIQNAQWSLDTSSSIPHLPKHSKTLTVNGMGIFPDGRIYACAVSLEEQNHCYILDEEWTELAHLEGQFTQSCLHLMNGDSLWLSGGVGSDGAPSNSGYTIYRNGTISEGLSLKHPAYGHCVFEAKGELHVTCYEHTNEVSFLNSKSEWETKFTLAEKVGRRCICTYQPQINVLWLVGGTLNDRLSDDLWKLDMTSGNISREGRLPYALIGGTAFIFNNELYVAGGNKEGNPNANEPIGNYKLLHWKKEEKEFGEYITLRGPATFPPVALFEVP